MISRPPGPIPLCSSWQLLSFCLLLLHLESLTSFASVVLSQCSGSKDSFQSCHHVESQAPVSFIFFWSVLTILASVRDRKHPILTSRQMDMEVHAGEFSLF